MNPPKSCISAIVEPIVWISNATPIAPNPDDAREGDCNNHLGVVKIEPFTTTDVRGFPMVAAVTAESVSKGYGDTVALGSVSLFVDRGDIFALLGPNGAGKTTLVQTLTGTTEADSGTVSILGDAPEEVDKERIGHLPQSFTPPERLTARELLSYYAGLYENPRDVDDILADVGLMAVDDTWYANLSGGQQRRVCVGIALVNDPELLFLDEPTTGIDPAGRQSLWSLVRDLASDGTTIFLTTHYMKEAEELADHVALLDDGELVETGSPATLVDAFGGGAQLLVETTTPPTEIEALGLDVDTTETGVRIPDISPVDIGDVVEMLDARDIEYDSIVWSEPTLEDVYLRLTDEVAADDVATGRDLATVGGAQ